MALSPRGQSTQALLDQFVRTVEQGESNKALTTLSVALRESGSTAAWLEVGHGMLQRGLFAAAADLLEIGIADLPRSADLHYLRGNSLRLDAQTLSAEQEFRTALRAAPDHRDTAFSLAFMLRESGRLYAAADVLVALHTQRSTDIDCVLAVLGFLRECGAYVQAKPIALAAIDSWPRHAAALGAAGEILLATGTFGAARDALRRALDLAPDQSAAWLRLAYCQRFEDASDADLRRIEIAWRDSRRSQQTHICTGFALGKARDELSDFTGAVEVLREANALAQRSLRWNSAQWQQLVDVQLDEKILPVAGNADLAPVFIVGLPRSGTTLVATRLAAHADVRDRGELNWIPAMFAHLQAQSALHDVGALRTVAALVSAQMRRDDASARWYIDKNPLNLQYLNLIAALFPAARIIHCRRNLRDSALSIWSQHFAHDDLGFAYSFADIAQVARGQAALLHHWQSGLSVPILEIEYESLVTDSETQLDRLAQFLDLPGFDATQRVSPDQQNVVTTASVWQARQPVYTRSVGRWRNYAKLLPELEARFVDL